MPNLIEIAVLERGRYRRVPNGPFAITPEQLEAARRRFRLAQDADTLGGARMAPASTAREILSEVAPALTDFDRMVLAYAVTSQKVRITQ
jgi:hypothetical protein